jgi:outer membrane protein OmpA-like peptidoglycan-associated protein
MKTKKWVLLILAFGLFLAVIPAEIMAEDEPAIVPIYEGSELIYDDQFGFEELPVVLGEDTVNRVEGYIRRLWLKAPEGRSPYEIIRNYEAAVESINGKILFKSRDPQAIQIGETYFSEYFSTVRQDRGLATHVFTHSYFPEKLSEYLVSRATVNQVDNYIIVAAGKGHMAASQEEDTYFEIIILELEAMEMDMVTMEYLESGIEAEGRVAVYDILFDTGEARIKAESEKALAVIADFLSENSGKKYLVVGHTDYIGSYEMNLNLSEARAEAVVEKLISQYNISGEQLISAGVGPAAPVMSNRTENGRAKNRRVEIVELD